MTIAPFEAMEHDVNVIYDSSRVTPHDLEYEDYMALERALEEADPERRAIIHSRLIDHAETDPPHPEDQARLRTLSLWAAARYGRRDEAGEYTGVPGGWVSADGLPNTIVPPTADGRDVDWSVLPGMRDKVAGLGWPVFRAWYACEEPDGPYGFLIIRTGA